MSNIQEYEGETHYNNNFEYYNRRMNLLFEPHFSEPQPILPPRPKKRVRFNLPPTRSPPKRSYKVGSKVTVNRGRGPGVIIAIFTDDAVNGLYYDIKLLDNRVVQTTEKYFN